MIGLIDGGSCSSDFNKKTSSSIDSLTSAAQNMFELMRLVLVVVLMASRSKNRRIVKKSKKPQRSEKFTKVIDSKECLPKHRSFVNWIRKTQASIRVLTLFRAPFTGPRSSFDTTFRIDYQPGSPRQPASLVLFLRAFCTEFLSAEWSA